MILRWEADKVVSPMPLKISKAWRWDESWEADGALDAVDGLKMPRIPLPRLSLYQFR